jgi:hypothetical protein
MRRLKANYGQLDRALRSFGFTRRRVEGEPPAIHYEHEETGALISIPPFRSNKKVAGHHVGVAIAVLKTYDIAESLVFAVELYKAGAREESTR